MCNMNWETSGQRNEAHRLYKFQSIIYLSPRPAAEQEELRRDRGSHCHKSPSEIRVYLFTAARPDTDTPQSPPQRTSPGDKNCSRKIKQLLPPAERPLFHILFGFYLSASSGLFLVFSTGSAVVPFCCVNILENAFFFTATVVSFHTPRSSCAHTLHTHAQIHTWSAMKKDFLPIPAGLPIFMVKIFVLLCLELGNLLKYL